MKKPAIWFVVLCMLSAAMPSAILAETTDNGGSLAGSEDTQPTYTVVNVSDESIKVVTKQINGAVVDEYTIIDK